MSGDAAPELFAGFVIEPIEGVLSFREESHVTGKRGDRRNRLLQFRSEAPCLGGRNNPVVIDDDEVEIPRRIDRQSRTEEAHLREARSLWGPLCDRVLEVCNGQIGRPHS